VVSHIARGVLTNKPKLLSKPWQPAVTDEPKLLAHISVVLAQHSWTLQAWIWQPILSQLAKKRLVLA